METLHQKLNAIFEIAKILVTEQDLDTMISRLLTCLTETLKAAETAALEIYDPQTGMLTIPYSIGYTPEPLRQIRLLPGEALGGLAFKTRQAELYTTPEQIEQIRQTLRPPNKALFEQATVELVPPQSAICIPLFTQDTQIGALIMENRAKFGRFEEQDVSFLEAVGDLIAISIENIQLRKELQENRTIKEANRLKAELLSTLAHEMRTPLTSIKGYSTALLMEETTFSPTDQKTFLQIIDQECDLLQELIQDLLESSIIDAGLLKLERQPTILQRLVEDVIREQQRYAPHCQFVAHFSKHFPVIEADPHRIEQVLRNLVSNAIKYSPNGGLIVISGQVESDHILIGIADQGIGIPPQDVHRLFEKFFRAKTGLVRHIVGSGLGLPIARTIVESHGGRIWVESQVGQGSTFYFTLPLETPVGEGEVA